MFVKNALYKDDLLNFHYISMLGLDRKEKILLNVIDCSKEFDLDELSVFRSNPYITYLRLFPNLGQEKERNLRLIKSNFISAIYEKEHFYVQEGTINKIDKMRRM